MIHELIDPKKKKDKTRNTKAKLNTKTILGYCNFESSCNDTKNTEISSATFIPPWLRNSLGLNQKNLLSHATANSDEKPSKIIQRSKEPSQNDFNSLRQSGEPDCCKEWKNQLELEPKECNQIAKPADDVKTTPTESSGYRQLKTKESETESNYTYTDFKFLGKGDWKKIGCDVLMSSETGNLKEEDIRKIKLIRQKNKLKKRMSSDQKPSTIGKSDIDFLLQMKAREVVENFKRKDVHSLSPEIRNLETKLLLLGVKPQNTNCYKLKQQDIRFLQEMKNQIVSLEDFEKLLQHIKQVNLKEIVKSSDFFPNDGTTEKKREEKDEKKEKKSVREIPQKREYEDRIADDHDYLLSTDDEDNVKRFSQFLSKNDNLEEKKKCLEEVRNYFEKKRKFRLSRRRCSDEKNSKSDKKDESNKEKLKSKSIFKGMKSKFGFYDEDIIEKALEETIQKFTELYHINLTPAVMEIMKKSIFQYMTSNIPKTNRSPPVSRKTNLDHLGLEEKEPEKIGYLPYPDESPSPKTDSPIFRELQKENFKSFFNERVEPLDVAENEKFKLLRKDFDNFLNAVQFNIDFTNLKLQSVILEKEESASSKNVQFVYNFTKKSLEQEKTEVKIPQNAKEDSTQTQTENELSRRNVKVQAFDCRSTSDQNWQTEDTVVVTAGTQTDDQRLGVKHVEELKNCDVSPGLYRMVKSKEAGKFYLYPEQIEERKRNSHFSFVTNKRLHRKKEFYNVITKGSSKDRRFYSKDKDKVKSKRNKKVKNVFLEEKEKEEMGKKENHSLNCLYFRNLGRSHSGMLSARKDATFTDANTRTDESEDMGLGDSFSKAEKNHLGCFWFWDGEKIAPGCDLKTHVENLLKEKLNEFMNYEYGNAGSVKPVLKKIKKLSKKTPVLGFSDFENAESVLSEEEAVEDKNQPEEYKNKGNDENKETMDATSPGFEEKLVRSVATQNSVSARSPVNLSKLKISSCKSLIKKNNKGNLVIKYHHGKPISMKKAEHIVEAIEELKKIKLDAKNSKNDLSRDSESILNYSVSTKESKTEANEPLPTAFGRQRQDNRESPDMNFENKLKKLVSLVNCEIQRNEAFDGEDGNSTQNSPNENQKQMELIETVLNRITHKERESLWNDVREFIKNRISRGINDDDEREVCIEIEQDLRKNDRGELREILAKGHFRRNEGDIEVEIDLTLDDLERLLRQRQKKIRRRSLYRSSVTKFLSNSSIQSDLTKEDFIKYQKYFHNLTTGGGRIEEEEMKAFL